MSGPKSFSLLKAFLILCSSWLASPLGAQTNSPAWAGRGGQCLREHHFEFPPYIRLQVDPQISSRAKFTMPQFCQVIQNVTKSGGGWQRPIPLLNKTIFLQKLTGSSLISILLSEHFPHRPAMIFIMFSSWETRTSPGLWAMDVCWTYFPGARYTHSWSQLWLQ